MRKIICLLMMVSLMLMLAGCAGSVEQTGTPSVNTNEEGSSIQDGVEQIADNQAVIDQAAEGQAKTASWEFEDTVLVGRVYPASGSLKTFGTGTPYVEREAINTINEQGGVMIDGKRCQLRLLTKNSNSTNEGAEAAARELIEEGVDVMMVSHTAATVNPVSAVCEELGILCISVDAPASAWSMGGPYANSWHTFFDNEREMLAFYDAWEQVDTNKKIGLLTANDSEGIEISSFIHDFAKVKGYTIVDIGAYHPGQEDYSEYIDTFSKEDCDIILGVMVTDDFKVFWKQMSEAEYKPKMCTIAKACLFETDIENLDVSGDGLITEVWWTEDFPYHSSITGQSCHELAGAYLTECEPYLHDAPPTVGYKHANVEILYDILKRAGTLDLATLNKCAAETDLNTIIGRVSFNEHHISVMPCVTGQWVAEENGKYRQEIIGNYLVPAVKVTEEIKLLESK